MFIMKKSVVQRDSMGCGIACVACVCDISYDKAKSLFKFPENANTKGYTIKAINEALASYGLKYKSKYIGRARDYKIKENSIVYFKKCKIFPYGHYMVKTDHGYMDPFINLHEVNYDIKKASCGFRKICTETIVLITEPIQK